jgi:hypothetical protein
MAGTPEKSPGSRTEDSDMKIIIELGVPDTDHAVEQAMTETRKDLAKWEYETDHEIEPLPEEDYLFRDSDFEIQDDAGRIRRRIPRIEK